MKSLPDTWAVASIDQLCVPTEQVEPDPRKVFTYVDIGSVDRNSKKIVNPQRMLGKDAPSRARKRICADDTIVSTTRPNLNAVALVDESLDGQVASTGFEVLRSPALDARWIAYLVRTNAFVDAMTSLVQGALYPAIRGKDVKSFLVPVAPRNEQRRIADKIDTALMLVYAASSRLARVAPILKRFRQSVLTAATSGRLSEDWRAENEIGKWDIADIKSVAYVGTGTTPLRSVSAFYAASGMPWTTSAATASKLIKSADQYVTQEAITAHRLKVFLPGTLLVAMYGEGKTRGQVSELGIASTINQACAAIVVDEHKMSRAFVKLALQASYLEMRELAEGGNQPNLNLAKIKDFTFPRPPLEEQIEIVRRVETLFAFADRLEARLQTAKTTVDRLTPALLAKAFRGELVPQDPNDEPAAELLKRLRAASSGAGMKPARKRRTI